MNRKEYLKQWRLKNKEHIKEYYKEFTLKNPEYNKEHSKTWRLNNKEHVKQYNLNNREHQKESTKQWCLKNKEHIKEYRKKYDLNNKENIKKYQDQWRLNNKEHLKEYDLKNREHRNEWQRNRKKTNPYLRLVSNMRSGMSAALQGRYKSAATMKIIGCTVEELFEHFESCLSWEPWMTRKKYGVGGWDVDHIIAIARWCENCPLQFALCWDKSNLQPMEHIANLKKGHRYEMEQAI